MKLIRTINNSPFRNPLLESAYGRDFFIEPDQFFNQNTDPKINISENNEHYRIELAAPGYQKDDFNIEVDNHILTISVNRESNSTGPGKYSQREFSYGSFTKSFRLPKSRVRENNVSAEYTNGILQIVIPKAEIAQPAPKRQVIIS